MFHSTCAHSEELKESGWGELALRSNKNTLMSDYNFCCSTSPTNAGVSRQVHLVGTYLQVDLVKITSMACCCCCCMRFSFSKRFKVSFWRQRKFGSLIGRAHLLMHNLIFQLKFYSYSMQQETSIPTLILLLLYLAERTKSFSLIFF